MKTRHVAWISIAIVVLIFAAAFMASAPGAPPWSDEEQTSLADIYELLLYQATTTSLASTTTSTVPVANPSPFSKQELDFINAYYTTFGNLTRVSEKGIHLLGNEEADSWISPEWGNADLERMLGMVLRAKTWCGSRHEEADTYDKIRVDEETSAEQRQFVLLALAYLC